MKPLRKQSFCEEPKLEMITQYCFQIMMGIHLAKEIISITQYIAEKKEDGLLFPVVTFLTKHLLRLSLSSTNSDQTAIETTNTRKKFRVYFFYYLAKWAKALLASAILWVSAFFFIAFPSFLEAKSNSSDNFSAIPLPFLARAASIIHLKAK